jgi:hypothetical protein
MSVLRFVAIAVIFGVVSAAWMALGGAMWARTEMLDRKLSGEMHGLWGPSVLAQPAPYWGYFANEGRNLVRGPAAASASRISADIRHSNRYKGLLWYSTFTVEFDAQYSVSPAGEQDKTSWYFVFELPGGANGYDSLSVVVNDVPRPVTQEELSGSRVLVSLDRKVANTVRVRYTTNGQDAWIYSPGPAPSASVGRDGECTVDLSCRGDGLAKLSDFQLSIRTNFREIDYPKGARSPSTPAAPTNGGMEAQWKYADALTAQPMGVAMPRRTNAGPIAARMSFFAPASLFFFFAALFTVVVIKQIPLHPMHYLFIAAGFFAFHILMAYLADIVPIHAAFWICAAVSVLLVVSYMRLVAGVKFAVTYVGLTQLIYLIGFSYAFFWAGRTGLVVTIGAVLTLFVLMQATGRVKWHEVLQRRYRLPLTTCDAPGPIAPPPPLPV